MNFNMKKTFRHICPSRLFFLLSIVALVFSVSFAINDNAFYRHDVDALVIGKHQDICGKYHNDCFFVNFLADGHAFEMEVDGSRYQAIGQQDHVFLSLNRHGMNAVGKAELINELLNLSLFVVGFTILFLSFAGVFDRNK